MQIFANFATDITPSFDASNARGALSTNVLTTAEFCFLSAAVGVVEKVKSVLDCKRTYLMVF